MTLFGIRIKIHILSPLILMLLMVFSGAREVWIVLACLSVHEFGHLLCAWLLKAQIDEIELMPYGAAIRLYGLWELHPVKLLLISLAGPAASLALSACAALAACMLIGHAALLTEIMLTSLLLCGVNLIPALPLDGGRCLCAVMSLKFGRTRAVQAGILLGRLFSLFLLVSFVVPLIRSGEIRLMPLLSAVYIFASARQEKAQSEGAVLRMAILKGRPAPVARRCSLLIADAENTLLSAVKLLHPGESAVFAVRDESGKALRLLPQEAVLEALIKNANATFRTLM